MGTIGAAMRLKASSPVVYTGALCREAEQRCLLLHPAIETLSGRVRLMAFPIGGRGAPSLDMATTPEPAYITYTPDPIDIRSAGADFPGLPPRRPKRRLILAVCAAVTGSILLLICISISVRLFFRRLERRAPSKEDDEAMENEFRKGTGPKQFRYSELAAATDNFSDDKKLGEGGFGSVYRGFLKDLRIEVAIKRVSKGSNQGRKEYASEVRVISRLRHRNLVQIVGWCHARGELLLVYELMPNGSLDAHLHGADNVLWWPVRSGHRDLFNVTISSQQVLV